jgi:hypothetical protein
MLATEPALSIVWDEGYTLGREERVRAWFTALRDPATFARTWRPPGDELVQPDRVIRLAPAPERLDTHGELFSPEVVRYFWPFSREEPHGHPPFYALAGLLGDLVTPWRAPLERARLGPILFFSMTAGWVWVSCRKRWGFWPAAAALGSWLLQPNLFAHGHYAGYDGLLTSLWVCAVLAFMEASGETGEGERIRWKWVIVLGVIGGWAADTKLTGWFLPVPFLVWSLIERERRAPAILGVAGVAGLATLILFNPPWWFNVVGGIEEFLRSNLTRGRTIPIKILFLGRVISTPDGSLPWYNTLVWTLLVTPVGFLALGLLGAGSGVVPNPRSRWARLFALHWVLFLVLRGLPHTPGHDGVRLFLPAFGCLALLAAPGAHWLLGRWPRAGGWVVGASWLEGLISIACLMPTPLSYYSPLVGGLPGAARLGMEPTYYWDALDGEALDWINRNTAPGEKVAFASNPSSWLYLRREGKLKPDFMMNRPGVFRWYVVQNRPGAFSEMDHHLIAHAQPAYLRARLGVPLLWIFPFEQVEAWHRANPRT